MPLERCQIHDDLKEDMKATYQELRDSITQLAGLVANLYEWKAGEVVSYKHLNDAHKDIRACVDDIKKYIQEVRNNAVTTDQCTVCVTKLEVALAVIEQQLNELRLHSDTRDTASYTDIRDRIDQSLQNAYLYADKVNKETRSLIWKLLGAILTVIGIGLPIIIILLRLIIELLRDGVI